MLNVWKEIRLFWYVLEAASSTFSYRTFCLAVGMLPYVLCLLFAVVLVKADRCNDDDDDDAGEN